jgi:hypothetical protein
MKTSVEAIRRMGNPYAKLSLPEFDENEDDRIAAIRRSGNPYAKLSMFIDDEIHDKQEISNTEDLPLFSTASSSTPRQPFAETNRAAGLSKAVFETRCRSILSQYEPMRQGRPILRLEFRNFIANNRDKSAAERSRILEELLRYDLSSIPGLKPHLNRENEASLLRKLTSLTAQAGE